MLSLCSGASEACCSGTVSIVVGTQLQISRARSINAPLLAGLKAGKARRLREFGADLRKPALRPEGLHLKITVSRLALRSGASVPMDVTTVGLTKALARQLMQGLNA